MPAVHVLLVCLHELSLLYLTSPAHHRVNCKLRLSKLDELRRQPCSEHRPQAKNVLSSCLNMCSKFPPLPSLCYLCMHVQDFELTLDINQLVAGARLGEEGAKVDIDYDEFKAILA